MTEEDQAMRRVVEQHSLVLYGDPTKQPRVKGVVEILQQVSDTIANPKHGNEVLKEQVDDINNKDIRRMAFFNGAKWLTLLIVGAVGGMAGFIVGLLTMLRTH